MHPVILQQVAGEHVKEMVADAHCTAGTSGTPHAAVTDLPAHDAAQSAAHAIRSRAILGKHRLRFRWSRQLPWPSRRQRPGATR